MRKSCSPSSLLIPSNDGRIPDEGHGGRFLSLINDTSFVNGWGEWGDGIYVAEAVTDSR